MLVTDGRVSVEVELAVRESTDIHDTINDIVGSMRQLTDDQMREMLWGLSLLSALVGAVTTADLAQQARKSDG